ncbi:unnamed protein product [Larinioides sclopetarius]|uniref:Phosphomannomutase n=1 Tax=Larinioides sclopetarius TaxID=280406 RepID=A0AAV2BDA3_9ARAC
MTGNVTLTRFLKNVNKSKLAGNFAVSVELNKQIIFLKFFCEMGGKDLCLFDVDGTLTLSRLSILKYMGEEKLQPFINFCLGYMSQLSLPAKRGNFVEFRSGLINICPVGRSCSQKERDEFAAYDKVHRIREQFIEAIQKKFPDLGLNYSIGGQISFDCFPIGWDKTYCLKHIFPDRDTYGNIHFFGDKTFPGGNDYELFSHEAVIGHTVTSPEDTMEQLKQMYFS